MLTFCPLLPPLPQLSLTGWQDIWLVTRLGGEWGTTQLLIPVWSGTTTSTKGLGSFLVRFIIKTCFWWLSGQQKAFLAVIQLNSFPLTAIQAQYLQIRTVNSANQTKTSQNLKCKVNPLYSMVGWGIHITTVPQTEIFILVFY